MDEPVVNDNGHHPDAHRVMYSVTRLPDWILVAEIMRRERGWEPCHWTTVRGNHEAVGRAFPKVVRHWYYDAIRSVPAPEFSEVQPWPLDAHILQEFRNCESQVLRMMDRLDLGDGSFTYPERLRHYHRLLRYFLRVVDELRPDIAVFASTPHAITDYVLYEVCRVRGVRTVILTEAFLPNRVAVRDSIEAQPFGLQEALASTEGEVSDQAIQGGAALDVADLSDALPESARTYICDLLGDYSSALPGYMKRRSAERGWRRLVRRAANATKVHRWGLYYRNLTREARDTWLRRDEPHEYSAGKMRGVPLDVRQASYYELRKSKRRGVQVKCRLRDAYDSVTSEVDLTQDYVYMPLHYQPERTTCPEGGDYAQQSLIVDLLSACLPDGWLLYVREHSLQFGHSTGGEKGRLEVFYHDLHKNPRVRLVPLSYSSFDLIDKARAVATITGTAGWEGLVRGKPVLVFGAAWYRLCNGAFPVSSINDVAEALRAVEHGAIPTSRGTARFIEAFYDTSVEADTGQAASLASIAERSDEVAQHNAQALARLLSRHADAFERGEGL